MKQYITVKKFLYTVLTANDSEMWYSMPGDIVTHNEHTMWVNGTETIDQVQLIDLLLKRGNIE